MRHASVALVASSLIAGPTLLSPAAKAAGGMPARIGQCVATRIRTITTRLEGAPGSGSAVVMANGGYQVSYDQIPDVDRSRPGDPLVFCLVQLPRDCPKGDDRGKIYKTTNKRTGRSWTLPDSQHSCGGA